MAGGMTPAVLAETENERSEEEGQDASFTAAMIVSTMVEELTPATKQRRTSDVRSAAMRH